LRAGANILAQKDHPLEEKIKTLYEQYGDKDDIKFIIENKDRLDQNHVFEINLIKTFNNINGQNETIVISNDVSHLKQKESDVNNLINLLKDLKYITSYEISHEIHKLQSIVELAQDLDFVDPELKEIFSTSKETFKKADVSIKKLMERINIPLQKELIIANSLKRIEKVILIEEDEISAKISLRLLNKFFDPIQVICLTNVDEAIAFIISKGDEGNDLILLDYHLKTKTAWDFLNYYENQKLKSPVVILGSNPDHDLKQKMMAYECVKNFIQKPINKEIAQAIFNKEILVWNS
jgi:CheY-like chemotaxis protein